MRVGVTDDTLVEGAESFYLNLFSPTNSIVGTSRVTATIVDNDGAVGTPAIGIGDPVLDETAGEAVFVVRLDRLNGTALLSVLNEGPVLPEEMRDRLFDPMISVGKKHAKHSRLGLGLYVVRLIAEFHHGHVEANNRNDADGAIVTVTLPLAA